MRGIVILVRRWRAALLIAVTTFLHASVSHAAAYAYRFDTAFSGAAPAGPAPWVDATFADLGNGTVSLTISNNGLTDSEFISGLYFNLNSNFNATSLSFQFMDGSPDSQPMNI